MAKQFFCLLILWSCLEAVHAQNAPRDPAGHKVLRGIWVFPEGKQEMSLAAVLGKWQEGRFDTLPGTTVNFGRSPQRYWLRFQLKEDAPPGLLLELSNAFLYQIELYRTGEGKDSLLYRTGINYPFRQRPVDFRRFTLPLINQKGPATYYLLLDRRNELLRFSLQFYTHPAFQSHEVNDALFFGLIIGILVFIAFFNLVLWVLIRDPLHLWYLGYICCILLFIVADNGFGYKWLWSDLPLVQKYIRNFLSLSALSVQLRFMQLFLGQSRENSMYATWSRRIQLTSIFLLPLLLAASILDSRQVFLPAWLVVPVQFVFYGCFLAGACLILLGSYEKIRQRQRMAWIYASAMLPLITQVMIVMLSRWHVLTVDIDTAALFALAVLLEIVILGMGVVWRYHRMRLEKIELSSRLMQQQHLSIKKVMAAQEAERQRIAEDLHDQLGSTLSAVKGMVSGLPRTGNLGMEIKLEQVESILGDACRDLRNIAHNLMPAGFENMTLAEVLEESIAKANESGPIRFFFMSLGEPWELGKETCLGLVRIASELIHNIIRHSGASEATLQLLWHTDFLELIIEDNGHGFDTGKLSTGPAGIGIKSIFSRAEYLNAEIRYDANKQGTTVICTLSR